MSLTNFYLPVALAAARAAFFALTISAISLYRFMQSFLLLFGKQSEIFSHRSAPIAAGYVLRACSSNFCSSALHGARFTPCTSAALSVLTEASASSTCSNVKNVIF